MQSIIKSYSLKLFTLTPLRRRFLILTLVSLNYGSSNFGILGAASCIGAVIGAPLAAVVIVFELTGSYEWSVLAMVSVVTSQQFTRAYAGRSLFDRQLSLRGIKLSDDHK